MKTKKMEKPIRKSQGKPLRRKSQVENSRSQSTLRQDLLQRKICERNQKVKVPKLMVVIRLL